MKLSSEYFCLNLSGTPRACGREYGEVHREAIGAFLKMEVMPDRARLQYARRCAKELLAWEKSVAEFAQGMAQGSGLSFDEITLLLLHEEIFHQENPSQKTDPIEAGPKVREHCTAFGATGRGSKHGAPLVAMNWDWAPRLYPWSSLTKINYAGAPGTLTYGYPGLWAGAGLNEEGLSLVWTGSGYFPKVAPLVGVPTYALIAGILTKRNCREAIDLVGSTRLAGCFIFFIGDANGEVWVLEGGGGKLEVEKCEDVIGRANHYECAMMCRSTKQKVPTPNRRANSKARGTRMAQLIREHFGRVDGKTAQKILCDHGPKNQKPGLSICQHPVDGREGMTLDSLYILPQKRELWIARGVPCRHEYSCHTF